jgi:hypothetical protein
LNSPECAAGESLSPGSPIKVQIAVFAPRNMQPNLADIVKPMVDGFISALHYYVGKQLDSVVNRLAERLKCYAPEQVRALLLEKTNALLGPCAVPHLRAEGLQWSPADHVLIGGEIIREDSDSLKIRGRLVRTS